MSTMTKNDLIRAVAQKTGFTQKETQNLIETTLSEIQDALGIGHRVEVRGFGIWEVKLGKARIGRNPSNPDADPIQIGVLISL